MLHGGVWEAHLPELEAVLVVESGHPRILAEKTLGELPVVHAELVKDLGNTRCQPSVDLVLVEDGDTSDHKEPKLAGGVDRVAKLFVLESTLQLLGEVVVSLTACAANLKQESRHEGK